MCLPWLRVGHRCFDHYDSLALCCFVARMTGIFSLPYIFRGGGLTNGPLNEQQGQGYCCCEITIIKLVFVVCRYAWNVTYTCARSFFSDFGDVCLVREWSRIIVAAIVPWFYQQTSRSCMRKTVVLLAVQILTLDRLVDWWWWAVGKMIVFFRSCSCCFQIYWCFDSRHYILVKENSTVLLRSKAKWHPEGSLSFCDILHLQDCPGTHCSPKHHGLGNQIPIRSTSKTCPVLLTVATHVSSASVVVDFFACGNSLFETNHDIFRFKASLSRNRIFLRVCAWTLQSCHFSQLVHVMQQNRSFWPSLSVVGKGHIKTWHKLANCFLFVERRAKKLCRFLIAL